MPASTTFTVGSPRCHGCGLHHLLPGNRVYRVPTTGGTLTIACGCVIESSVRLTRLVCRALTPAQFGDLLAFLSDPAEIDHAEAMAQASLAALATPDLVRACGLCGNALSHEDRDDLCFSCYSSMRGW